MKQSKLEKFIHDNRYDFDSEDPSLYNWKEIEHEISSRKSARKDVIKQIFKWVAAAVIFVGVTSIYFLYVRDNSGRVPGNSATVQSQDTKDSAEPTSEFDQETREIFKAISDRRLALQKLSDEQPTLYAQFTRDLAALDSAYNILRQEAKNGNNQEVVLGAMLQNLRLQAALLAKQLTIIQQYSPNKIKADEKDNYRRI